VKAIKRWFKDMFSPEVFNNLDTALISGAFNDPGVRALWLAYCFDEIRAVNMEVDKRLLSGNDLVLTDLCARRRAFQDVLEAILSARRKITQGTNHNPRREILVDLDRVTV
jgi:hypothetical protein